MGRFLLISALVGLLAAGCSSTPDHPPLETVDRVDLNRYMGKWYEIARLPAWFQRGCVDATAEYEFMDDGRVSVINSCLDGKGNRDEAKGIARVVDPETNAKLKVSFGNWFVRLLSRITEGDYWIIYLEPDYSVAIVATPNRDYLWILSREPEMDDAQYDELVEFCRKRGFDTSKLIRN